MSTSSIELHKANCETWGKRVKIWIVVTLVNALPLGYNLSTLVTGSIPVWIKLIVIAMGLSATTWSAFRIWDSAQKYAFHNYMLASARAAERRTVLDDLLSDNDLSDLDGGAPPAPPKPRPVNLDNKWWL